RSLEHISLKCKLLFSGSLFNLKFTFPFFLLVVILPSVVPLTHARKICGFFSGKSNVISILLNLCPQLLSIFQFISEILLLLYFIIVFCILYFCFYVFFFFF